MADLTLYYVTNRNHIGKDRWSPEEYGSDFSADGIENLRFGKVILQADERQIKDYLNTATDDKGIGDGINLASYLEKQFRANGKIRVFIEDLTGKTPRYGSQEMYEEVKAKMMASTDTMIYTHGYAVSWYSAVARALSLQLILSKRDEGIENQKVLIILFTWPSDGRYVIAKDAKPDEIINQQRHMSAYRSDRVEAEASGGALARGILKLRDLFIEMRNKGEEPCNQSIHLLCHSMGNYVLQNALSKIANHTSTSALPSLFEHIFLCSADADDTVLEPDQPMGILHQLASSVSIYYNREDKALWLSDKLKGNPDRLGTNGAARPAAIHKKIHQIDCTSIVQEGILASEHSYYMYGKTNCDIRLSIANISHYDLEKRKRKQIGNFTNEWRLV